MSQSAILVNLLMRMYVQERWENHVVLRSSIIFGPQAPNPVSRALFLQFIERTLKAGKATKFFTDEFRSPVYVPDILAVVRKVIEHPKTLDAQHRYSPLLLFCSQTVTCLSCCHTCKLYAGKLDWRFARLLTCNFSLYQRARLYTAVRGTSVERHGS